MNLQPNSRHNQAIKLLSRKRGASIEDIEDRLGLRSEKSARNLLDTLKAKGHRIENIGSRRFRLSQ